MNGRGRERSMEHSGGPAAAAPRDGRWRVTAAPFTRAGRLRAFLTAVGRIEGVSELVAERFQQGEVALRLRYAGAPPLAGCLAALVEFTPRVETVGGDTLRLRLEQGPPNDWP